MRSISMTKTANGLTLRDNNIVNSGFGKCKDILYIVFSLHQSNFAKLIIVAASTVSYSSRPYVGRGKSFSDRKGPKKPSGQGRGQGRPMPTGTLTRPGQSKEGQTTVTASASQDFNKRKAEPRYDISQTPRKNKHQFRGKSQGKKQ